MNKEDIQAPELLSLNLLVFSNFNCMNGDTNMNPTPATIVNRRKPGPLFLITAKLTKLTAMSGPENQDNERLVSGVMNYLTNLKIWSTCSFVSCWLVVTLRHSNLSASLAEIRAATHTKIPLSATGNPMRPQPNDAV